MKGTRINRFGQLADGSIRYNLSPPPGAPDFSGPGLEFGVALARLADGMGGNFEAEHGLGRSKIALAEALRSPVERGLMARIKRSRDPVGVMDPRALRTENRQE